MRSSLLLVGLLAIICLSSGCFESDNGRDNDQLPIAVTILPMKEIAEEIGGNRISVTVVVPPGAQPHTFEPTPALVSRVSGSKIFFRLGPDLLPFEDRLVERISSFHPDSIIVDLSDGIDLIQQGECGCPYDHGDYDPHIWLSPRNGAVMAEVMAGALIDLDPEYTEFYSKNLARYIARINEIDQQLTEDLADYQNNRFIVTHDAWGYFARDYGLEQVAIHVGGREPTARDIQQIVQIAEENSINVIFVEPQFSHKAAVSIAEELKATVVVIDPLAEEYLDNFLIVADAMKGAMT